MKGEFNLGLMISPSELTIIRFAKIRNSTVFLTNYS